MRFRSVVLLVFALLASAGAAGFAVSAHASTAPVAQQQGDQTGGEEEAEGQESGDEGGAEEETGAGEGQTEEGASSEEAGPPWTFQMARLGVLLIVVLFAGIAWWYYRFVVQRQRGVM